VKFHDVPWGAAPERIEVQDLGNSFWLVKLHFDFMNTPDVPKALELAEAQGPAHGVRDDFFLSARRSCRPQGAAWRTGARRCSPRRSRNASGLVGIFRLPDNAVSNWARGSRSDRGGAAQRCGQIRYFVRVAPLAISLIMSGCNAAASEISFA